MEWKHDYSIKEIVVELYNSMSGRVESLAVVQEPVNFYVCGITPYDTTHLGHAFTYAWPMC